MSLVKTIMEAKTVYHYSHLSHSQIPPALRGLEMRLGSACSPSANDITKSDDDYTAFTFF